MWQYIKTNKLQDPKNKQFVICDEKLKKVNQLVIISPVLQSNIAGYSHQEVPRVWDDQVFRGSHVRRMRRLRGDENR